jgi:diguanylate cyclase (GGDEF)-like protein
MPAWLILLGLWLACAGLAGAAPPDDPDGRARIAFSVDAGGKLGLTRAMDLPYGRPARPLLYPGYTGDAYWLRILPPRGEWLLELQAAGLDYIDVYVPDAQDGYRHLAGGDSHAQAGPDGRARHPRFALPADLARPVYARIAGDGALVIAPRLWRPAEYPANLALNTLGAGLYLGMLLLMALYNLILYFSLRDRRQLYYAGFIASFCLHQAAGLGYGQAYLWPGDVWLANHATPLLLALCVFVAARFIGEFLDLARKAPNLVWPLRLLRWAAVALAGLGIVGPAYLAAPLADALGLAALLVGLILGILRARQGVRPVYWFSAAWAAPLLGLLLHEGALAGYLPYVWPSEHAARLGGLALAILLSLALADRAALLRLRKLIAQSESNKHLKDLNAGLKTQVRARAAKLRSANKQLAEKNRILADIARHDGLTGLLNHASFMSLVRAQVEEAHRYNYPISLVMIDLDHFKRINDRYGHQLGDRVLAAVAKIVESGGRVSDTAGRYGGEEFALLLPHADLDAAVSLAERLREHVRALRIEGAEDLAPSASFGVACIAGDNRDTSLDQLVQYADQALYRAKSEGRDRVRAWP